MRSYGRERYQSTYHERDVESGFDYRGARFYDSDVARFNSLDPLAADYAEFSDYLYVAANPLVFVDPTGKNNEEVQTEDEWDGSWTEDHLYLFEVFGGPEGLGDRIVESLQNRPPKGLMQALAKAIKGRAEYDAELALGQFNQKALLDDEGGYRVNVKVNGNAVTQFYRNVELEVNGNLIVIDKLEYTFRPGQMIGIIEPAPYINFGHFFDSKEQRDKASDFYVYKITDTSRNRNPLGYMSFSISNGNADCYAEALSALKRTIIDEKLAREHPQRHQKIRQYLIDTNNY